MNRTSEHAACRPESLTLYHYGELPEADRLRTERHLEVCAACRRELEGLRSDLELLPKGGPEISPARIRAFNERVARRLRPRLRAPLGLPLGWSVAGAAALLLTMTFLAPPTVVRRTPPEVALQKSGPARALPEPEMLLNLELLENLDLLQELETTEIRG